MYSKSKNKPRKSTVYADFGDFSVLLPLGKIFLILSLCSIYKPFKETTDLHTSQLYFQDLD